VTYRLGGGRSIHLSYGGLFMRGGIYQSETTVVKEVNARHERSCPRNKIDKVTVAA
jgi:hypothetical protein